MISNIESTPLFGEENISERRAEMDASQFVAIAPNTCRLFSKLG
jgi:hypothetical protein